MSAAGSRHRCWDWCCPSRPAAVQVWRRGALHRLTSKLSFQSTFPGAVLSGHQTSCWTGPALLQCRGRSCLAMQTLLVAVTPQRRPQADTLVHHLTRQQAYSAASRTTKDSISSQPHTRGRGHGGWGVGRGQRELARLWLCRSAAARRRSRPHRPPLRCSSDGETTASAAESASTGTAGGRELPTPSHTLPLALRARQRRLIGPQYRKACRVSHPVLKRTDGRMYVHMVCPSVLYAVCRDPTAWN